MSEFRVGDIVIVKNDGVSTSSMKLAGRLGRIIEMRSTDGIGKSYDYCKLDIEKEIGSAAGGIWLKEIEMAEDPNDI